MITQNHMLMKFLWSTPSNNAPDKATEIGPVLGIKMDLKVIMII